MGARAQVHIKDTGVYLYTHWGANRIVGDVFRAISKKQRWGDPEYLTRIIFDAMKRSDIESEIGYGIGTQVHGDIEKLITVSCASRTIEVKHLYSDVAVQSFSFSEFNYEQD